MKNDINIIWADLNEELFAFMLSQLKDEELAKDLHQEVFIKVQTKIHQLKHSSKLTSWVYQITRNTIIDHFRKTTSKNISLENVDIAESEVDNFKYSNLSTCINQKIKLLSATHQEVILLTAFQNYTQKELAEHLKISYSGTKSRVQKAREILKNTILDCPNLEADSSGKLLNFEKKQD
ncbi:RNA polymerase, sigma-24 subunit, ECF subfamily [Cellulophaga algicola DSM 14237]|uniref:RNA polymerase, sigma-24 subunit, ECF subfamily n=1 Tax=Cellulophaga algicola (strain DSM 14237 / IC166 / ACAM 630) TaxID=688270 RepID=E6XDZ9_CELAD|nr:sigma-70 family RNA polymerase sigma factor [Cellulophaga algicola]ADV48065.1 RNA polymerase, sigma-24 subunit, ECF subfamily [Cellulophaga algicola DSM 14237]